MHIGTRGNILRWFESYLTDRSQYVTYDGIKSNTSFRNCGVPQGSILGPLLFIIFINDIFSELLFTVLYADDACFLLGKKNLENLITCLNNELKNITTDYRFQRLPPARGGIAQRKIFHLENRSQLIHPGPSSSRSRFFMESSQLYAATLTHYSTEPLTTGPDYDPLLLLLALAGDVHPNPGPSRYPCSVCFKNVTSQGTSYLCTRCSHWVHSRCSGLRNAADYRKANGWICTACMTPPRPRTPSPPPSPAHMPTMSDKTFNILQWNANGIGNKQTELSIFLEAHNVKVAAIQESKLTAKSRSPNIQNYTLVRHDRRQGPGGGLLFFIHNSQVTVNNVEE